MDDRTENNRYTRPLTIVVDGSNYAGKSTLVRKLRDSFARTRHGEGFVHTAGFPRANTYWGAQARKSISDVKSYPAVSAELVAQDFAEALQEAQETSPSDILIWDRFYLTTCTYQGFAGWRALLKHNLFDYDVQPDFYIICDVEYETAIARRNKRWEEEGKPWDAEFEEHSELRSKEAWDAKRELFLTYTEMCKPYLPNTVFLRLNERNELTVL